MSSRKALVVFYSRSGTTRVLADLIAAALDADVEEIADVRERSGVLGWVRSIYEATSGRPAAIGPQRRDPAIYDLVVVGTPVWNARVSSPVRAWLERNATRLPPAVALFATMGGRGGDRAVAQMSELIGKTPRATLVAIDDQVWRGRMVEPVAAFMHTVEQTVPSVPPPPLELVHAHAH